MNNMKSIRAEIGRVVPLQHVPIIVAALALAMTPFVRADTEVVDDITWTYQVIGDTVSVGSGSYEEQAVPTETTGAIAIPSTLGGKPVTSIGDFAFSGCEGLTSATIPSSVTNIGEWAFENCSGLTSVTIPSSVTSIGVGMFSFCSGLTSVVIPSGVTHIGDEAFWGCNGLTSVELPSSVTHIGNFAFDCCSGLTSVTMSEGVTSIGESAFSGCSGLTSVVIPLSVTHIDSGAFAKCTGLTSITIPSSATLIGDYGVFSECSSLASVTIADGGKGIRNGMFRASGFGTNTLVTISEGVASIGDEAFRCCCGITSVVIPSSVTSIGEFAFADCSDLTAVTIPEGVTKIGEGAFSGCSGLTAVTMSEGLTNIGEGAFAWCDKLTTLIIRGDCPAWTCDLFGDGTPNSDFAICVSRYAQGWPSDGYWNGYKLEYLDTVSFNANGGVCGETAREIRNGTPIGKLPSPTLEGCEFLGWFTEATGGEQITESTEVTADVTWYAHWEYEIHTDLIDGVTWSYAIQYGHAIVTGVSSVPEELVIPETLGTCPVTSIGDRAFAECFDLASVTIPSSVMDIGEYAFYCCSGLTAMTLSLPSSVTSIGDWAFSGCPLDLMSIPSSVTSIGEGAFCGWSGIDPISIPSSVTNIGVGAFAGRYGESSLAIDPDNPCYCVYEGVLYDKNKTTLLSCPTQRSGAFTIPSSVTNVYGWAFYGCKGLTSVTIPSGVTSIGDYAFHSCKGLASMSVPSSVTRIGEGAFVLCDGLTSVTLSEGVTDIGKAAFQGCDGLISMTIPSSVTKIGVNAFANCCDLVRLVFSGNAPTVRESKPWSEGTFSHMSPYCVAYVGKNSTGWGVSIPGTWYDLSICYNTDDDPAADPLPDLGEDPTPAAIAEVFETANDAGLAANITDGTSYTNFCDWAERVQPSDGGDPAGAATVLASPHAWLSYALARDRLLDAAPTNGQMKVVSFSPSAADGKFDFTVGIDAIPVGDTASPSNLAKVFGLEGGTSLAPGGLSSKNVTVTFGTPENGRVKFTAGPKDSTEPLFFMRVKLTP